jgi:outer membrane receptor protein involved in Fe transport
VSLRLSLLALILAPVALLAQQPTRADSLRADSLRADSLRRSSDTLTHTPAHLQAITVTAAATPRQAPVSIIRISPAVIAATQATSPWDLLRQVAGIEVHEQGQGPGFASDASIRGFSSDHSTDVALWIDGVPVNEPVNGHAEGYNDWSLLMPQAVSSMEVLKGPTSAVYGNFAMAGVINVLTRERMTGQEFAIDGGANGRVDGTFFTGIDRPNTGLVLGLRGMRDGGWRPNSEQHLGQLYGRLVQQISSTATLDIGTQLYAAGWDSPGFLSVDQFDAGAFDNVSNPTDGGFKRHALERASLRVVLSPALAWRTTTYATQGNWNFFLTVPPEPGSGEGSGSQTQEVDKRNGWGATSALTWVQNRFELTVGGEGRLDMSNYQRWFTTDRSRDSSDALLDARQLSGALFLQSTADVGHHLRFTLGGRYDDVDTRSTPTGDATTSAAHGVFSPKFGALIHLPRFGDIYGNISRGFRSTDGVIEDPALPFITEWAYETGLHVDLTKITGSIALFRTDVSNEQTFDPILLTSSNGGRSRRDGVEFSLNAPLGEYARLAGSWTFTNAKYLDQVTPDGDNLAGVRVANTAKYVGEAAVDFGKTSAAWSLRLSSNVVGPYTPFDEPDVVLPAYALVHFSSRLLVGGRTTFRLGVRNLFDKTYPELRAGGFVSPGQPRSVYGGVSYVM